MKDYKQYLFRIKKPLPWFYGGQAVATNGLQKWFTTDGIRKLYDTGYLEIISEIAGPSVVEQMERNLIDKFKADCEKLNYTAQPGSLLHRIWHPELYKNDNALGGFVEPTIIMNTILETAQNFGQAVEAMKKGFCVARAGWNGKNMFVYMNKGSKYVPSNEEQPASIEGVKIGLFESGDAGTITRLPNINMRTAGNSIVTGWLASQTDMLAEDWDILAPEGEVDGSKHS